MHPREIDRDAEGTDGIPDTDAFDAHLACEALAKEFRLDRPRMRRVGAVAIELVGRVELSGVLALQEASVPEQASDAARRIRPTAKTEEENLVVGVVVVLDEEHVGVLH